MRKDLLPTFRLNRGETRHTIRWYSKSFTGGRENCGSAEARIPLPTRERASLFRNATVCGVDCAMRYPYYAF